MYTHLEHDLCQVFTICFYNSIHYEYKYFNVTLTMKALFPKVCHSSYKMLHYGVQR